MSSDIVVARRAVRVGMGDRADHSETSRRIVDQDSGGHAQSPTSQGALVQVLGERLITVDE